MILRIVRPLIAIPLRACISKVVIPSLFSYNNRTMTAVGPSERNRW